MKIPNCGNCRHWNTKGKDKWNRCKRLYKQVHCGNVCPEHEFENKYTEDINNADNQKNSVDVPPLCGKAESRKQG